MKANELMVGDWVYKPKYNGDALTYIVEEVEADDLYLGRIYDFKPIPLTAEILKKNGFVYDSEDKLFEGIYPRISMLYARYRLVENGGINYGEMSEIKYVHELQNALKLCKIKKEIKL